MNIRCTTDAELSLQSAIRRTLSNRLLRFVVAISGAKSFLLHCCPAFCMYQCRCTREITLKPTRCHLFSLQIFAQFFRPDGYSEAKFLLSPCPQADQIYKLCSVLGTPTRQNWPEGLQHAAAMHFRFPQFAPTPLFKIIQNASQEALDLMGALCHWDPNRRPTAVQCLQHPYFQARSGHIPGTFEARSGFGGTRGGGRSFSDTNHFRKRRS